MSLTSKSPFKIGFPSRVRSNNGCWTCRLRRKKCDEKRPVCGGCKALEITCHFEDDKPEWMDGGRRQREMADYIKLQVKKQASQRRDRKYLEMLEDGTKRVTLNDPDDDPNAKGDGSHDKWDGDAPMAVGDKERFGSGHKLPATSVSGASDTDHKDMFSTGSPPESSNTSGSPPEMPWQNQNVARQDEIIGQWGIDTHFIMIYLDYVFPHLFPFYRPPILVGGRGWVLEVINSNKTMFHNAMSFASYYFKVILNQDQEEHRHCIIDSESKLHGQLELGLRELQKEMSQINARKSEPDRRKSLVVLQSILKMLIFDVGTSNSGSWRMHLDAAIALFRQIIPRPDMWSDVLQEFGSEWMPDLPEGHKPWSTPQASLRFFTANLLYIDVMSSITLEIAPRLQLHQAAIIPGCADRNITVGPNTKQPLSLDDFLGIRNFVLQMIGDISSLAAWKKSQLQAGTLSMGELVNRGTVLVESINAGLLHMEACLQKDTNLSSPFPRVVEQFSPSEMQRDCDAAADSALTLMHNLIWLHACLPFLYTVISGWQPTNPEIRRSVIHTRDLLLSVPKANLLSTLIWPIFVAGCLSPPEDEDTFRGISNRLGPLQAFGTIRPAMQAMEAVWDRRAQLDESWNIAKSLNVLGYGILLI